MRASQAHRLPEICPVQRAGERIGEAKRQHGRDPALRELEAEARPRHGVLVRLAPAKVLLLARAVDAGRQVARARGALLADEHGEVVVGHVHARVSFRLQRGPEEDEILADAGVQDHHGSLYGEQVMSAGSSNLDAQHQGAPQLHVTAHHGAAGVVEEEVLLAPVADRIGTILGAQVVRDAAQQRLGVIAVHGDGVLRNLLQPRGDEDEACVDVRVEDIEDGEEKSEGQECGGGEVHLSCAPRTAVVLYPCVL